MRSSILARAPAALAGLALLCTPALAGDRALIIGVRSYPHLPADKQLLGPLNDAALMARVAREVWGFHAQEIKILRDGEATSAGILGAIESWLIDGTRPGDRALLFYSGHGAYTADDNGDEGDDGRDETLAPSDVRYRPRGSGGEGGGLDAAHMVRDDAIGRLLDRLKGRDVMVVIDSCHSGTVTRALLPAGAEGRAVVRSAMAPGSRRVVTRSVFDAMRASPAFVEGERAHVMAWSAVAASELSHEDMRFARKKDVLGVFTGAFARGLLERKADGDGNGRVSVAELHAYVRAEAARYCREEACRTAMTPTLEAPEALLSRDLLAWRPRRAEAEGEGEAVPAPPAPAPTAPAPTDLLPAQHIDGSVRIALLDKGRRERTRFRLGEQLKIRIESKRPGWLIVLDVRGDGSVVQLFPSVCAFPARDIRAHAPLTLPTPRYGCAFPATEPDRGHILAIVTEDNVPLDALLARHKDLTVEKAEKGRAYLAEIAARLMGVWTAGPRNRPARWSLALAPYEIGR